MKRILTLALALCLAAAPAWAAEQTVETAADLMSALTDKTVDTITVKADASFSGTFTVNRTVKIVGASGTTKPTLSGNGSNPIFVVASGTFTLENLVLQNANAPDGGGVYVYEAGKLEATDCDFKNNTANNAGGGAAYIENNASATFKSCTFADNSARVEGGAIVNNGTLTLEDCTFTGNSSSGDSASTNTGTGGAIDVGGKANLTAKNCVFTNNSAKYTGGAIQTNNHHSLILEGCGFTGNTGKQRGGALHLDPNNEGTETTTLTDCDFTGNKTEDTGNYGEGGAIYQLGHDMTARNCTFVNNTASGGEGSGGAIYWSGEELTLINCVFTGNSASGTTGRGGAVRVYGGPCKIVHSTFVNNSAKEGLELSIYYSSSMNEVVNSVIYNKNSSTSTPAVYTGQESVTEPEKIVVLDNCAATSDVLDNKGVDPTGCKTISSWTPERVTFKRANGHEATVVQTAGITLDGSDTLTGKALSSIVSGGYGVTLEQIEKDMTGRTRNAGAPELGAVSSGTIPDPNDPDVAYPVIVSFDVEGLKDGGTMVLGRTYTATATATGAEITWYLVKDSVLSCDCGNTPAAGNSTTFTIEPIATSSAAKLSLTATNVKGSVQKSLTFAIQSAKDAASEDVKQVIDETEKKEIAGSIGNTFGNYTVKTVRDVVGNIPEGGYVPEGIVPDASAMTAITSGGASLAGTLPAFKLEGLTEPVLLVLRVSGLTVSSDLVPHLYKMRGATVAAKSAVQLAAVDTSEDTDATFLDGSTPVTTVTSTDLYVAALYSNDTYAPVVVTTRKTSSPTSNHSGGCNTGLGCLAFLALAGGALKRRG